MSDTPRRDAAVEASSGGATRQQTMKKLCANLDVLACDLERENTALLKALRDHDGWLERTGHGNDHPLRLSIARALAQRAPKVTM